MIFPSNRVRIVVATKPVDFRKGHDGLTALVKNELRKEPFTGTVFVFRAKRADRLKMLYWDGTGLVMTYKRLEENDIYLAGDPGRPDVAQSCPVRGAVCGAGLAESEGAGGASAVCGRVTRDGI
ncbi:IS66 family insertion sequence element accessory protein TnpB [Jhaorihella thermophila]|uniref:IS66 family insertion sequence element accessory protein TnpB n=1 Tax=Jhaorihella thermophila TaxID=488547 RepID=UPI00360C2F59